MAFRSTSQFRLKFGEVVDEPEMDHAVGRAPRRSSGFPSPRGSRDGPRRLAAAHSLRRCVRARETEDLMARADQVGDDGRADESAGASNKYTHGKRLRGWTRRTIGRYTIRVKYVSLYRYND